MMRWTLELLRPEGNFDIAEITPFSEGTQWYEKDGLQIKMEQKCTEKDALLTVTVTGKGSCYLAVNCRGDGKVATFSGDVTKERYIRQSPHDPDDHVLNMDKEAVPMAAILENELYTAVICDQPGHCDNATTQHVFPDGFSVCSGDRGSVPGEAGKQFAPFFHDVTPQSPHVFRLLFTKFEAQGLNAFRNQVFRAIDRVWGTGGSGFHSVCFSGNYMHYRKNETGYSDYWVVPGIEYANKQYTRDAFWQSMILPEDMAWQCYQAVYPQRYKYAECGLIFLIWSYRVWQAGGKADLKRAQDAMDYIKDYCKDGCYLTGKPGETKYDFKSWYDICAFETDDVITYNQGLLAVAMMAAEAMGIAPAVPAKEAAEQYRRLFNGRYFPLSRKKQCLSLDVLIGDVLSFLLFDQFLLPDDAVRTCYEFVTQKSQTPYGCKVVCGEDGGFLPMEAHGAYGYVNEHQLALHPGEYAYGGSYYLYEMLFHIGGYLHGAPHAQDQLIARGKLDFTIGGTFYEHINTVTGQGNKANQGWNAAIYRIWEQLMERGLADDRFFREIETVLA